MSVENNWFLSPLNALDFSGEMRMSEGRGSLFCCVLASLLLVGIVHGCKELLRQSWLLCQESIREVEGSLYCPQTAEQSSAAEQGADLLAGV